MDEQVDDAAQTEAPDGPRVIEGEATEAPPALFWALWVGAFFVILWGMNLLFGRNRSQPPDPG